jgi:NADH-quinone oxidoreductase subunit N
MLAYVAIEGASLTLYVLGSFLVTNLLSLESIIKYFLLNSITSSIMLLGISLIFGIVGSLNFIEIQTYLGTENFLVVNENLYLIFIFSLTGFFFKLSFFPFN